MKPFAPRDEQSESMGSSLFLLPYSSFFPSSLFSSLRSLPERLQQHGVGGAAPTSTKHGEGARRNMTATTRTRGKGAAAAMVLFFLLLPPPALSPSLSRTQATIGAALELWTGTSRHRLSSRTPLPDSPPPDSPSLSRSSH